MMFDRFFKQDIEKIVLCQFMSKPERICESEITSDMFMIEEHSKIFDAIVNIYRKGYPVNWETVYDESKCDKKYIISLYLESKDCYNLKIYYDFMKENSIKFKAVMMLNSIVEESKQKDLDVFGKIQEVLSIKKDDFEKIDHKQDILETLERKMKNGGKIEGILTNITELDETLNGFQEGLLYICGARSSMGKSAFMCSCLSEMTKSNICGVISLEMTTQELYRRITCLKTKIPYWVIDKGRANEYQFNTFASEINNLENVYVSDKGGLDSMQVSSRIRSMVKKGCKIIFIDHLGLIKVDKNKNGNLAHAIGEITSSLKSLAKELKISIVCLCQLNRSVEKQTDQRPKLSDIRESGRIEEDADCVFFLYRPEYYQSTGAKTEIAEIIVAKNRNGETKKLDVTFENQIMKWS